MFNEIANQIRTRRVQLGLEQKQVAALAGITRNTVNAIESGASCTTGNLGRLLPVLGLGIFSKSTKSLTELRRGLAKKGFVLETRAVRR